MIRRTACKWLALWSVACWSSGMALGQSTAPSAPASVYEDRLIEGLPPETQATQVIYDDSGWPRYFRWDLRAASRNDRGDVSTRWGSVLYGQIETPNHGSLSADINTDLHGGGGTFTLRQRALPLNGGWLANHELGLITAPSPQLLRSPSRIFIPSPILQGASADWQQPRAGWSGQITVGEPGQLSVYPDTQFDRLPGLRTRIAGQWNAAGNPDSGMSIALQHENARGITPGAIEQSSLRLDTAATVLAIRQAGSDWSVQGHWMQSGPAGASRNGFWLDAEWNNSPRSWGAGLYRLDTDLRWAELPMASDAEGAYLRGVWRQRQWSADGSIDVLRSMRPGSDWGHFATLNTRWRLSRDSSLGAGGAVREVNGSGSSAYLDWRFTNTQGAAGLRLEHTQGLGRPNTTELAYDQNWNVPAGWTLSTSLGVATENADVTNGTPADTLLRTAISLSGSVGQSTNVQGNLSSERGQDGRYAHNLSLNAQWRLSQRWSLEGNFNRVLGRPRLATTLDPLIVNQLLAETADRSFLVLLRYQLEAGRSDTPLGGSAGAGSGRVEGVVFFDANRNGLQEASELGVPGVTVYLDNRYAVRTDSQGRFDFPSVGTGARSVTVRNETLPLPWAVVNDGQVRVDVRLRDAVRLSLPVQRPD